MEPALFKARVFVLQTEERDWDKIKLAGIHLSAKVAELADAPDLGSGG